MSTSSSKPRFLSNRTFAVQLATETQVTHGEFVGRVEHVDSMRATHFHSLEELGVFILQMVTTLPDMGGAKLTAELTKAGGTR